jgi:arsenite methyltransferase
MPTSDRDATAERIRSAVAARYSMIGANPALEDAIPRGRAWAERLGYPPSMLSDIPPVAVDSFTGINTPLLSADVQAGEHVLDLGCGAGLDSLLAAKAVGPSGHVYGVDHAPGMVANARQAVDEAGAKNVTILEALAEAIPLPDQAVDVAMVNGLFNLAPDKAAVAAELHRVLRPDGRLVGAEIVITNDRPPDQLDLEAWFR